AIEILLELQNSSAPHQIIERTLMLLQELYENFPHFAPQPLPQPRQHTPQQIQPHQALANSAETHSAQTPQFNTYKVEPQRHSNSRTDLELKPASIPQIPPQTPTLTSAVPRTFSTPPPNTQGLNDLEAQAARLEALMKAKEESIDKTQTHAPLHSEDEEEEEPTRIQEIPFEIKQDTEKSAYAQAPPTEVPLTQPQTHVPTPQEQLPQPALSETSPTLKTAPPPTENLSEENKFFEDVKESQADLEDESQFDLEGIFVLDDDPIQEKLDEAALYLEQEEYDYAIELYQQVLQEEPQHLEAQRGIQSAEKKRKEKADSLNQDDDFLLDLDSALQFLDEPGSEKKRNRVAEEIKLFQQAVQESVGEDEEETHFELGIAYQGMGLYSQAIEAFRNCIRHNFRQVDCYKMIGNSFTAQGKLDDAIGSFQQALDLPSLDPQDQLDLLFETANAHEQKGDTESAIQFFQRVFTIDQNYRRVAEKLQNLQK
ncbi:MAG: tetratricopeptide repeat protein, partial [Myxococcota bacterium]